MSIATEIERLQNAKSDIKTAIENKGVVVGDGLIDTYAEKIDQIQTGGGGSQYPIIEGNGEHEVRFVDYDGTLIKVQYVNDGENATAPELPTHDRLTFVQWNRDYTNVKHDVDVGALYKPTSGNTELFINVTEETGLKITLNIYRNVSSGTITVNWGDGKTSTFATGTGSKSLTHTYSDYGEYMISIISTINYRIGNGSGSTGEVIKGSNEDRKYGALIKCYCSEKVVELTNYCCYNTYSLEEFTMISVTRTGLYSFVNTKQKAVILPATVTNVSNRLITNSSKMEYLIFPTNITTIGLPITISTRLKKLIFPENYKNTNYTYVAQYDAVEYVWYAKPDNPYTFGTNFGNYSPALKYIPIYDNFEGMSSTAAFWASDIEAIAFPPSTKQIGNTTLYQSGNLTDVYIYTDTVPTLGGQNAFGSTNSQCKIHVKPELLSQFQEATNWSVSTIKNKLVGDLEGEFKDGYCQKISRDKR